MQKPKGESISHEIRKINKRKCRARYKVLNMPLPCKTFVRIADLVRLLSIRDDLIMSTSVDLCEIWLKDVLRCKLRDHQ